VPLRQAVRATFGPAPGNSIVPLRQAVRATRNPLTLNPGFLDSYLYRQRKKRQKFAAM
jgi:hypothetical protein